ncbi:hypothetical protein LP416_04805 [Polaromonas sp. P2-4]|nr:hypothetical protein LP416_04805 [Polaromonas sp. P2-4]
MPGYVRYSNGTCPVSADQDAKPDDTQVASLALGVAAPGQLAGRLRVDVGIEVRRVEREHVGGQLEAGHRSLRDGHLGLLQLLIAYLLRDAMKGLAGERRARQTRQARQTRVKKLASSHLGPGAHAR